jgi:exopolysaccharide biosynthesis polyprenyl glycosylphosphotransferase
MSKKTLAFLLIITDWLIAILAWSTFYYVRKVYIENTTFTTENNFFIGLAIIPIVWISIFAIQGTYHDVRRLYRVRVISMTFIASIIVTTGLFFVLLLDDDISDYRLYYVSAAWLFGIHFSLFLVSRLIFVSIIVKQIHNRKRGFRTLIIGGSDKAVDIYNEISQLPKGSGHLFVGFVNINGIDRLLEEKLPYLGHSVDLEKIMRDHEIEEVIIALESVEHDKLKNIISRIEGGEVTIKILPDMYDIISGSVKMNNIFGALLIEVNSDVMPIWQLAIKRFLDVIFSCIALILLIPVYIVLAIAVKSSSPGPIFFLQERIGANGKPFKIIKFRTMYLDSEKNGPQLSSSNDSRITPIGGFMRKLRLDEFPQFLNVLVGDMSLVGPRPERQFFIDKIVAIEPQFLQLTKVRPGITSWGQVKYGYAENVEQMIQRMKYDLLYMKNRTLALDFKIMLYTILIVVKAKGK